MNVVKSQDMHITVPVSRIVKTEVQKKADNRWIVVAVIENDHPVTLARYSNENDALAADTLMWLCEDPVYHFPVCREDKT